MKIFGQHDEQTIIQFQDVRSRAVDAALMADGHVGYVMPIGGVAAYRDQCMSQSPAPEVYPYPWCTVRVV